jgi:type I restriction enzyme M protein
MNLLLHNIEAPNIHYMDTLSNRFPENFPAQAEGFFDVIMANPPFKGSLDYEDVHPSLLKKVKTKKTELLFVTLILKMLKVCGRSATIFQMGCLWFIQGTPSIAPDAGGDNVGSRDFLACQRFCHYAGVSTRHHLFTRGGEPTKCFFTKFGRRLSLDDKRIEVADN